MSLSFYQQAIKAHREGRHEQAIELFEKAIDENATDAKIHYNLGNVYADLDDYQTAISYYEQSLKLDRHVASVWYNLGNAYLETKQYHDAIKAFEEAVSSKTNYVEAWFNLGVVYTELQQFDEAKSHYSRCVELDPNFHFGWYNLACLFASELDLRQTLFCLKNALTTSTKEINYKEMTKTDSYFDGIRDNPEFVKLINS